MPKAKKLKLSICSEIDEMFYIYNHVDNGYSSSCNYVARFETYKEAVLYISSIYKKGDIIFYGADYITIENFIKISDYELPTREEIISGKDLRPNLG